MILVRLCHETPDFEIKRGPQNAPAIRATIQHHSIKYGCADLSIEDLQRNQSGSVTPIAGPSERPRIDDNVRATTRNRRTTRRPPPSPPKNRKNRKVRHRDPQAVDDSRARIRVARKKDEIVAKTTMVNRVFVGNLHPTVTSSDLHEVFSRVSEVSKVQIRCLGGNVAPTAPNQKNTSSILYASVDFRVPRSIHRILKVNGTDVKGSKLVVAVNASDLAEYIRMRDESAKQETNPTLLGRTKAVLGRCVARLRLACAEPTLLNIEEGEGSQAPTQNGEKP
ncbi:hypothetical protein NLI96_g5237 [Meripilus lineatus]|uniref:RRM domain-containing protein n=1 Tax=Meripilus lineatus TaxID=2056292 RepID=A0AAD5V377_9APHY|nr:hypothetical protein NLI96_g5237 [Physisporinus lineatus]